MHTGTICIFRSPQAEAKAECWFPSAAGIPFSKDTGHHARQTGGFHKNVFTVFMKNCKQAGGLKFFISRYEQGDVGL